MNEKRVYWRWFRKDKIYTPAFLSPCPSHTLHSQNIFALFSSPTCWISSLHQECPCACRPCWWRSPWCWRWRCSWRCSCWGPCLDVTVGACYNQSFSSSLFFLLYSVPFHYSEALSGNQRWRTEIYPQQFLGSSQPEIVFCGDNRVIYWILWIKPLSRGVGWDLEMQILGLDWWNLVTVYQLNCIKYHQV